MGVVPSSGSLPCTHLLLPDKLKQKVVYAIYGVCVVSVMGLRLNHVVRLKTLFEVVKPNLRELFNEVGSLGLKV